MGPEPAGEEGGRAWEDAWGWAAGHLHGTVGAGGEDRGGPRPSGAGCEVTAQARWAIGL